MGSAPDRASVSRRIRREAPCRFRARRQSPRRRGRRRPTRSVQRRNVFGREVELLLGIQCYPGEQLDDPSGEIGLARGPRRAVARATPGRVAPNTWLLRARPGGPRDAPAYTLSFVPWRVGETTAFASAERGSALFQSWSARGGVCSLHSTDRASCSRGPRSSVCGSRQRAYRQVRARPQFSA